MSPNVRTIEEVHTKSRILIPYLFEQLLPDTTLYPTDEDLRRCSAGAKIYQNRSSLRAVLVTLGGRRYGPSHILRRSFTSRTDRLNQRFPDLVRMIGENRMHHVYLNKLSMSRHHSRPE